MLRVSVSFSFISTITPWPLGFHPADRTSQGKAKGPLNRYFLPHLVFPLHLILATQF